MKSGGSIGRAGVPFVRFPRRFYHSVNIILEVGCMLFQMQFRFSERLRFNFLGIVL